MDSMGIDVQLVSFSMPLLPLGVSDSLACEMSRRQNEAIAEMIADYPDRFVASASVPLQNPESAARELVHANRTLGLRAVHICTNVEGRSLDCATMQPFWVSAAELQTLVLVHPGGVVAGAERMKLYYLRNLIGLPTETALAIAALIFGGVLEEHPTLRICFAHGGGFGPYGIARMDHGYHVRAECQHEIPRKPSVYLRHLYFDTVVHNSRFLSFLADVVGADRLVLGSDYPADMGLRDPISAVLDVPGLTTDQRNLILGATAQQLLSL
jgi:aminocarboxymuconate-semialdehyde decarboxylase